VQACGGSVPLPAAYSDVPPRPQNFDQVVGSNRFVLVYFYAPWNSFTKLMAPQFANAAAQLKALGLPVVMARVDLGTPEGQRIAIRFNTSTSNPSVIWFVGGRHQVIDLNSGDWVSQAAIVNWVSSAISDKAPAPVTEPCVSRVGDLCLSVSSRVFYSLVSIASLHILQALAWAVVSKRKLLFSYRHFFVVLFVPIFGLFMWWQLCRFQKSAKNKDTLLHVLNGDQTPNPV
jgi:thiol-disulfide isomerase/thioredoxin